MAGISAKEIKTRIRSMESTKQITKAMEMVAASKLHRAQSQVMNSRPYFEILYNTVTDITRQNADLSSPYLIRRPVNKAMYVVIAGDRGLAGGYNSNVLRLSLAEMAGKDAAVLPTGRKAVDFFKGRNIPMFTQQYMDAGDMTVEDCFSAAKQLCKAYLAGECDEIVVCYTNYVSALTQTPGALRLLPLTPSQTRRPGADILYEPNCVEVFDAIVPEYAGGILYGALCESRAAEQAARRAAMDSATQNAQDMIADLRLQFNQTRQAVITQEITEIVAGSHSGF